MSILFSTDKLIIFFHVLFKIAQLNAQVGLYGAYRFSKFERKRCGFDYLMKCFRVFDPEPPLCRTAMLGFCTGRPMGNLKVMSGESKQLLSSRNGTHVNFEDDKLYV